MRNKTKKKDCIDSIIHAIVKPFEEITKSADNCFNHKSDFDLGEFLGKLFGCCQPRKKENPIPMAPANPPIIARTPLGKKADNPTTSTTLSPPSENSLEPSSTTNPQNKPKVLIVRVVSESREPPNSATHPQPESASPQPLSAQGNSQNYLWV